MPRLETLVYGLDHPEGVAWDPAAGCIWAGGEAGQVYRVELESRTWAEVARAPGFVLGLAPDGRSRLAICCAEAGVYGWDGETFVPLAIDLAFANFPAFAPDGTLYVSDSGRWRRDNGRIVRIDVDGTVETLCRDRPCFTNGLAVSADGRSLWLVESYEPRLSRLDLETGACETVLRIDGTVLDGIAPAETGLLISCYRPDRIYHFDGSGGLEIVADDPQGTILGAPTNVCFAGAELDRVVAANLGRWHLTLLDDLGLRGVPLHRPERWALDSA